MNEVVSKIAHNKTILVEQKTSTSTEVRAIDNSPSSTNNATISMVIALSPHSNKVEAKSKATDNNPSSTVNATASIMIISLVIF